MEAIIPAYNNQDSTQCKEELDHPFNYHIMQSLFFFLISHVIARGQEGVGKAKPLHYTLHTEKHD